MCEDIAIQFIKAGLGANGWTDNEATIIFNSIPEPEITRIRELVETGEEAHIASAAAIVERISQSLSEVPNMRNMITFIVALSRHTQA